MWKKSKKIRGLFGCILAVAALCGCSDSEELFSLKEIGQSAEAADAGDQAGSVVSEGTGASNEAVSGQEGKPAVIYVHVCGAVIRPGVVEVPAGSRAQAAVESAGGFAGEADTAYVNLAAVLSDGEQLYVPTKEEAQELKKVQADEEEGLVNLNTAGAEQLCTLPGIGESRAGDIVAYRQQHGGFSRPEDIMQVPGIKMSIYEKIKDLITVY